MAEAGQRGSRGMGQPPRGGDQLIQPGALIALEQFDHARDLRALAGRWQCRRGRCTPVRRRIRRHLHFRQILVRVRRNGRAGYGLRVALIGSDDLQSRVSQFQRIRLARFFVAPPGFHSGLRFDLARQAGCQKLGRDLLQRAGFQGLRRNEAAILALRRGGQNRELRVGKFGQRTHRGHPLGLNGAVAVTTASPGPETSRAGPRNSPINLSAGLS